MNRFILAAAFALVASHADAQSMLYEVVTGPARVCLRSVEVHDGHYWPVWWADVNTLGCWPPSEARSVRRCAAVKRVATPKDAVAVVVACPEMPKRARREGMIKPYVYGKSSTEQLRAQRRRSKALTEPQP